MNNKGYAVPCAALLAALAPVTTTAATDVPAASALDEIVITASRTRQRLLDSPASLSVISETDLERSISSSLAEAMRDVPGLQVTDSGQAGMQRVRIRGEEARRTAILVDSQEITDHHEVGTPLTLHPAMVERIEVIRGSGSVLYGSRALSGVVNFITRKGGTEPLQATVSGGYDSATRGYDAFASVYGNVSGFEYRLAYSESDHENRQTPEGEMENTSYDNENLFLYAGKTFGAHRLEYNYTNFESSSQIYVEEEVRTTFPLTDFYLEAPRRDREKHSVSWNWQVDSDWIDNLDANVFHQQSDREFFTRSSLVWYEREIDTISELNTDGALLQLNLQPLGNHRLIAGIQYLNDDVDQARYVDTFAWVPPFVSGKEVIRDEASIETWAWFVQDQWSVTDSLSITAGLRQYFVSGDLEFTDRESLEAGSLDEDDELIGALGAVWSLADNVSLRANISQGYVYPSLMQLATGAYAGSRFVNPDPGLDPETSVNYEAGLRMQHRALVLDAAVFYTESQDYIHHLPCGPKDNCPSDRDRLYQNIGESRAHGVELYLTYSFADSGFEPYANMTWMQRRNEYEEFSTWETGIPALSGRLGLRWSGAIAALPDLWSNIYLRGESSSDLEEPGTVRNVLEEKSDWVTVNVAAGISFGDREQYQLSLALNNLTDKSYIASSENLYGVERSAALRLSLDW